MGQFLATLGITVASAIFLFLVSVAFIYWNRMQRSVNDKRRYTENKRIFGVVLMILTPYALLCLTVISIFMFLNFIR